MELNYLIKKLTKTKKVLAATTIIGGFLGFIVYFFPMKYTAQGSFYIYRDIQTSEDGSFSYEGFYSQQVAISFTKTVAALIESPDVGHKVISEMNLQTNEKNLREYRKKTEVVNSGPQIITLVTKTSSSEESERLWNLVAEAIEDTINTSYIRIQRVSEYPVVIESFRDLPVYALLGLVIGFGTSLIFVSFREYMRINK
ncbi:hypothetical protein JXA34_04080 [Patescibacteria group bacterium]|nr:hypothetical protein [Patescibacteria group bacterium]